MSSVAQVPADVSEVRRTAAGVPWKAVLAALLVTVATGGPWVLTARPRPDPVMAGFILLVHFVLLASVVAHTLQRGRGRSALRPSVVAGVTFGVFHVALNFYVLSDPFIWSLRNLSIEVPSAGSSDVLVSYAVLVVSWIGYLIGFYLRPSRPLRVGPISATRTPTYLVIGLAFVALGVLGNAMLLGGFGNFIAKMPRFYERWEVYEAASVYGGVKYSILTRFLPLGLIILGYGYWQRRRQTGSLVVAIALAGVANVFLSNASGSRSAALMTFFFAVIAYDVARRPIEFRRLALGVAILLPVVTALGGVRAALYFGVEIDWRTIFTGSIFTRFAAQTFTNYLGTLTLVHEVREFGVAFAATAFAGLTGLLGGPTPVTTQAAVWHRLTGSYVGPNARYGPPGELYYNFGLVGPFIGMILIGFLVKRLDSLYDGARINPDTAGIVAAIFAVMTAHFIVIANLSYIPPYFTYYFLPYLVAIVALRGKAC